MVSILRFLSRGIWGIGSTKSNFYEYEHKENRNLIGVETGQPKVSEAPMFITLDFVGIIAQMEIISILFGLSNLTQRSKIITCNNERVKRLVCTFTNRSPKFALKVRAGSKPRVAILFLDFTLSIEMEHIDALPPEFFSVDQA